MKLDPRSADKLAKICARFSSNHAGEISRSVTCRSIAEVNGPHLQQVLIQDERDFIEHIDFALRHERHLDDWQRGFVHEYPVANITLRKAAQKAPGNCVPNP